MENMVDDAINSRFAPLADRMRARNLEEFIGQEHLISKNSFLTRAIMSGSVTR